MLPCVGEPGAQALLTPIERFRLKSENPQLLVQPIDLSPEGEPASLASRKNEARLSLALKAVGMGTWEWDVPANHMEWDARMHQLFGLEPGEFRGQIRGFPGA